MSHTTFIVLTAQAATVFYTATLAFLLAPEQSGERSHTRRWQIARLLWSFGLSVYLVHIAAAFHLAHGWSHTHAYLETARRTEELFGVASGGGLWLNYLFTLVWCTDTVWWWAAPKCHHSRPRWVRFAVHGFMAFMFFNATVVFAPGPSRWLGLLASFALLTLAITYRRRSRRGREHMG